MHESRLCRSPGAVQTNVLRSVAYIFLIQVACLTCALGQSSSVIDLGELTVTTSASRRFAVMGKDPIKRQLLLRWAEELSDKVEETVGIKMRSADRTIRIVVREGGGKGVETTETSDGGGLLQRLVINDVEKVRAIEITEAFCQLLLSGHIRVTRMGKSGKNAGNQAVTVPEWLSLGLAQNLDQHTKAANASLVLKRWERGEAPSLKQVLLSTNMLTRVAEGEETADLTIAAQGLFVGWMLSIPSREKYFAKIMDEIGQGKPVTLKILAESMGGSSRETRMDDEWDRWILKQKRMVYVPGETTRRDIGHLRGELLLYPGSFGIPISSDPGAAFTFLDLIEKREAEWIPQAAKSKSVSLSLLALGRGKGFKDVVEAYNEFLGDLGERKGSARLRKKLKAAEDKLRLLVEEVGKQDEKNKDEI